MNYGIVICLKSGAFAKERTDFIARLCSQASPLYQYERDATFGLSENGSIFYYFSTNENEVHALIQTSNTPAQGKVLNFYYGDVAPGHDEVIAPSVDFHRRVNAMNGRFSVLSLSIDDNILSAATTITRMEPVYKFENSDLIVVSTWAYSINEVISALGLNPHSPSKSMILLS
ncbi:hypothetical protein [Roseinatronobacter monicus]|uniref:Uncharacterized protein n=1 Tax=Roseinatronobacter monicus TaxID=393481 RepID=A0A543K5J3_9RHOB|nr:hypothetical protein [Roseinatronobacter monicus]TQM90341.1 hypothetical protein BD293_3718 [Roseinatronobacter monicus]